MRGGVIVCSIVIRADFFRCLDLWRHIKFDLCTSGSNISILWLNDCLVSCLELSVIFGSYVRPAIEMCPAGTEDLAYRNVFSVDSLSCN